MTRPTYWRRLVERNPNQEQMVSAYGMTSSEHSRNTEMPRMNGRRRPINEEQPSDHLPMLGMVNKAKNGAVGPQREKKNFGAN